MKAPLSKMDKGAFFTYAFHKGVAPENNSDTQIIEAQKGEFAQTVGVIHESPVESVFPHVILNAVKDLCYIKGGFVLCEILYFAQNDKFVQTVGAAALSRPQ